MKNKYLPEGAYKKSSLSNNARTGHNFNKIEPPKPEDNDEIKKLLKQYRDFEN